MGIRALPMKGAAWGVPVVAPAVAVAAPAAAASGEPPAAVFAQQLWDVTSVTGVTSQFGLYGRAVLNGALVDAVLPAGSTVTFFPPAGATAAVSNIVSGTQQTNGNGSITVTFVSDLTEALAYVSFSGPGTARADGVVPGLTPETFSVNQNEL
jgi:hypothetical protein